MIEVTPLLVKELRERTGAGIMDCKNALIQSNGDVQLAINSMRKSGAIKAAKKAKNIATEGLIKIGIHEDYGVILELNCQTDFVAKDNMFQIFANTIIDKALSDKMINIKYLKEHFEDERIRLVRKFGENICIRRIATLVGNELNSYNHGLRIGVIVSMKNANKDFSKHIAMHIAASKPDFVTPEDVASDIMQNEYNLQLDIAIQSGKSEEISKKIVAGRMKKFAKEISLTGQNFIIDNTKSVGEVLKEKNADVISFIRFEVGEGIEKTTSNSIRNVYVMPQDNL